MQYRDDSPSPTDVVTHLVRFCRSLREHGLLAGPAEAADAGRSLAMVDILDREQFYWTLRTVLISRLDEVPAFDRCFRRFWELHGLQRTPPRGPRPEPRTGTLRPRPLAGEAPADEVPGEVQLPRVQIVRTGASPVQVVARRDLTALQGEELAAMSRIAARVMRALPSRPGRRRRRHRRKGLVDLRGALRLSLPHGGDIVTLPRRRRVPRVPRVLVLLDVSGSMDRHAGLLLQLAYTLAKRAGRVETFMFSTSLTRVTRHLKAPSFSEMLRQIAGHVLHWSGGTRIGECLATLNREYPRLLDRDTSVFLLSDGWETGAPEDLARELARLKRRVGRLIWLNPLLGTPDYQPLTQGLQAARPYVDTFASALDLEQLGRLPRLLER